MIKIPILIGCTCDAGTKERYFDSFYNLVTCTKCLMEWLKRREEVPGSITK